MDNFEISQKLGTYAKVLELHEGNAFKIKALASAAYTLKKMQEPILDMPPEKWSEIRGVGKTVSGNISELGETGELQALNDLLVQTPVGIVKILQIKGLGPKKVRSIWRDMEIDSVDDLYDACRENRLVEVKGFGAKTQAEIIKNIEFMLANEGHFHYARIHDFAMDLMIHLQEQLPEALFECVGDFARNTDTIERLDILSDAYPKDFSVALHSLGFTSNDDTLFANPSGLKVMIHYSSEEEFEMNDFLLSAHPEHLKLLEFDEDEFEAVEEVYNSRELHEIPVEMREGNRELDWAKKHTQNELVVFEDLKGCLHNHSTYSDGLHSLKDMAGACVKMGLEYFGICDHSQSAFYANGLKVDRLQEQWEEIDMLNAKTQKIKLFKGIESDILNNGNLDYEEDILKQFDFVVASVHSNLKMDEPTATQRLIKAIENPYTRILGHPTGRLLLMRQGYPINHSKIIDACAANGVCIELNAHPYRLDIDWRYIYEAMEKGVLISINPDAHQKEGLYDMKWGVKSARKGGLIKEMCLNAKNLAEFEGWLSQ